MYGILSSAGFLDTVVPFLELYSCAKCVPEELTGYAAQVETLLKSQEPSEKVPSPEAPPQNNPPKPSNPPTSDIPFHPMPDLSELADGMEGVTSLPLNNSFGDSQQNIPPMHDPTLGIGEEFSWEMIGLGLEEPLPNQDVIDDLYVQLEAPLFNIVLSLTRHHQPPNILREDPSICTDNTSPALPSGNESCSKYAASCLPALHHLVSCRIHNRQVYLSTKAVLPAISEIHRNGLAEGPG